MINRNAYRSIIKTSQITGVIDSIIFEPNGNGTFNMMWQVQSLNENVQFGILSIPQPFIKFLSSSSVPKTPWGPDKAYKYLSERILAINQQDKEYATAAKNLQLLQSNDKNQINNFINTGYAKAVVKADITNPGIRSNQATQFVQAYQNWLRGFQGKSQAIPSLASRKKSLQKISFREKQEK